MNKLLCYAAFSISTLLFCSCNGISSSEKPTVDSVALFKDSLQRKLDISTHNLAKAKELSSDIFRYLDLHDSKRINKYELDKIALPAQRALDSLIKTLNQGDSIELAKYRTKLMNDLVTRKVSRDNY